MYISTNKTELLQLAQYFYNITNTLISIYDEKENLICSYPKTMCEFCTEIRKNKELTDKTALLANLERVVKTYHVDADILTCGLMKISYHTDEYIQSIAKLLEMCANYIWLNSIISIKKEGMAFSIDLYIIEHLKDDLSVTQLCRQFNIGRSTLYEIAKNNFGCSINEYIQNYRNECAKELLRNRAMNISQVAEAVGIKDVNYFIRFFKKRNGCTPKAYQKELPYPAHRD